MFFQTTVPQKKPSERLAGNQRLRCARLTLAELLFVSYTIATPLSSPLRAIRPGSGLVKEHTWPSRTPRLLTG